MPLLFADPPVWLYLLLAGALVVTGAIAAQYPNRRTLIPFGIAFLAMMLVFLLDRMYESPREEAARRIYQMHVAIGARNPDAFAEHLADKVLIQGSGEGKTLSRDEMKSNPFWDTLKAYDVSVTVWDFSREDVRELGAGGIEIGFMGKGTPTGGSPTPVHLRATFTKQGDGSYKLTALRTFEPLDRTKPLTIPGLF
jgi:hypothetical protein